MNALAIGDKVIVRDMRWTTHYGVASVARLTKVFVFIDQAPERIYTKRFVRENVLPFKEETWTALQKARAGIEALESQVDEARREERQLFAYAREVLA